MKLPVTSGIYSIECIATGWRYIGAATCIEDRWYRHWRALLKGKHNNPAFQADVNIHGIDSLDWTVLEITTVYTREHYHAALYQPKVYSKNHFKPARIRGRNPATPTRVEFESNGVKYVFESRKAMSFAMDKKSHYVVQMLRVYPNMSYAELWERYGPGTAVKRGPKRTQGKPPTTSPEPPYLAPLRLAHPDLSDEEILKKYGLAP